MRGQKWMRLRIVKDLEEIERVINVSYASR